MSSMAVLGGSYDYKLIGLLLLAAITASGVALFMVCRSRALHKGGSSTIRERELYFQTMAEGIPEIIWTADPDGTSDFFNQKCLDYTGLTLEQMLDRGWKAIIHLDDLEGLSEWGRSLSTGDVFEVEYRLRGKDGTYRWFLCRANPIRNPAGEIVKWFGT